MDKELVLQGIQKNGLVAVVRAQNADQARRTIDACLEGGVTSVELTFTVPRAHHLMEQLADSYAPQEMLLGAGTVLDPETARIAMLSGAQYIVSPSFNADTMRLCNRYRVACLPGVVTPREAIEAMEAGADILKVFPANLFGPSILSSLLGPLPQAKLMPTGGVEAENAHLWIKAGAVALGAGSSLTRGAKEGDYAAVTRKAKEFMAAIRAARG
ncbi:MAG: bifunctional 2-keto-4-hydroxyglutarate aldolase/2-keto-3-deoxy-6-phosphogluconate aldolase [Eubacteriales bacterium]|nr:bifunctional 2-keto-4-hydroxyglutarate aldolase/2-keto-3-deoxy-6-phosphogluconate aldolase [Eubacteriales bacterium]